MQPKRSTDNPAVRRLQRLLKEARARREEGRAVAEGPHLAQEALRSGAARALWATPEAAATDEGRALEAAARARGLAIQGLSEGLMRRLSDTPSPQGWLCEVEPGALPRAEGSGLWLALDALQDPGNLGTLLRCAWAAGAAVLLGPGCADPWAPKVVRAGAGAHFHAPLRQTDDLAAELATRAGRGVRVFGTAPQARLSYLDADLAGPACLVLGSEGAGLSPAVAQVCAQTLRIPYPGSAESLNAAVSGAILLFEALRQKTLKAL